MSDCLYFDYAASTPPDAFVLERYVEDMARFYANASATHVLGLESRRALEEARQRFALCVGAVDSEIVFTSGATEANNLALQGAVRYHGTKNPRILTLKTEHKSVLDTAYFLQKEKVSVEFLPVLSSGLVDFALLEEALKAKPTTLVSVMALNNETGVVQDIESLAELVHAYGAKLHVDAAQALGKTAVDVRAWNADLVSFSGHKVYAPVGVGALFVRRLPKMRIAPLFYGGAQERGRRSGSSAVALVRALALALERAEAAREARVHKVSALYAHFLAGLPKGMFVHGDKLAKSPFISSVFIANQSAPFLQWAAKQGVALSSGSACQSGAEGSYVLRSMGLLEEALCSVRVSLSHLNSFADIERLLALLHDYVEED